MSCATYGQARFLRALLCPRSLGGVAVSMLFLASIGGPFRALQPERSWAEGAIPDYVRPNHPAEGSVTANTAPAVNAATLRTRPERIAACIEGDAKTAAQLVTLVIRQRPQLCDPDAYDISLCIARWSRNYGIRPEIVAALIERESRFNPSAVSATNDHGLMQLHAKRIYSIDENIQAGCCHLAGCLAAAGGNERQALAQYNGGGGYGGRSLAYADSILSRAKEIRSTLLSR